MPARNAPRRSVVPNNRMEVRMDNADDPNETLLIGKNNKQQMYGANPLYRTCIYCPKKFTGNIVAHYVKAHPEHEVPVSRLSPQMAMRLKGQLELFKKDAKTKKISGLCYFCEEMKCSSKHDWQR